MAKTYYSPTAFTVRIQVGAYSTETQVGSEAELYRLCETAGLTFYGVTKSICYHVIRTGLQYRNHGDFIYRSE